MSTLEEVTISTVAPMMAVFTLALATRALPEHLSASQQS